ncbi:6,7-dimethyl-8-ribityllumazine synthase [Acetobacter indonesiensis]|jgi:6,7-dimethyl-8-ribityllumazine synthase|uniref:6,7-dimethyl-8-ribityllumazine synthase n=1 Tax=Acetobacter indonesiensis TaxID=104101 RepID=UPI000A3D0950|nr:6,7-dimethyl-8-ribityllumazine synthase [Acetobacter indonesiensis]MCG0993833.1 6,7-dimethyl-8-ribityllumazine synthase [Acetobacter indonesiensis]MCI1437338.1 6,7-dimethyl-8-ribityllumazine synthase [Acetobacter indonesiensis]MCI1545457.1 6,7-dimethyl-8-ribityllumazine synthase [Acetobacter indonesiensis]MCI1764806.1 6,7-dimethyl-8-ribityllumazine synthase [Acetobacter indonesiensis]MCP1231184.1 6,7-dimethyl-8-ribityllumazine synthase [Acetobacter indonesiensis]
MSTRIPVSLPDLNLTPAPRLALIVSRFNEDVTGGLRDGAIEWLGEHNITVAEDDIFAAPGAFEMPLLAQTLAKSGRFEGVICLGCVIKGDTAHFEFISLGTTIGMMQASLATEVPIAFGVLTTYTEEQAELRSRNDIHNKGREAAAACVESLALLRQIKVR